MIENRKRKHVVLIHGLGSKKLLLKPLELSIRRAGYSTSCFGYRSWVGSIEKHATNFTAFLNDQHGVHSEVHVVAHSMGSVIARLALVELDSKKIGRVVLVAPPNSGSPIARIAGPILKPICPGISELSDSSKSLTNKIELDNRYSIGIIAARYDWMIPVSNTMLVNQSDHICLNATHNSLLVQPQASRQIVSFLQNGKFLKPVANNAA